MRKNRSKYLGHILRRVKYKVINAVKNMYVKGKREDVKQNRDELKFLRVI